MNSTFPILILNARPAAGKSEIIHYCQQISLEERTARFHIGQIHVLDDFPMLWARFEEDDVTSTPGEALGTRLGERLSRLWELWVGWPGQTDGKEKQNSL